MYRMRFMKRFSPTSACFPVCFNDYLFGYIGMHLLFAAITIKSINNENGKFHPISILLRRVSGLEA